jgi:hypothetical protein
MSDTCTEPHKNQFRRRLSPQTTRDLNPPKKVVCHSRAAPTLCLIHTSIWYDEM